MTEEVVSVAGYMQMELRVPVSLGKCLEMAWRIAAGESLSKSDLELFRRAISSARTSGERSSKAG